MLSCPSCSITAVPEEYQAVAGGLFPPEEPGPASLDAITAFADSLGIGGDFTRCLERPEERFLKSFQNNLDLLIQKTWVEKADETRKEDLQDRVPGFVDMLCRGDYGEALEEFGAIFDELAYLFFGAQSGGADFTEFVFRIDPQMGLFFWYGSRLGGLHEWAAAADPEIIRAVLSLGICYLTNF